jgi:hypothetical protein
MNIFCISLKDTQITNPLLLDWLTDNERQRGINHKRYWIIRTDTELYNPSGDKQIHLLSQLIWQARMHGFTSLMITKYAHTTDQRKESEPSMVQPSDTGNSDKIPEEKS